MGHIVHHAIVVTSWDDDTLEKAHQQAKGIGLNVTECVAHQVNGGGSFLVVPDGSKSGWTASDEGDGKRDALVLWLEEQRHDDGSSSLEWVEVAYGSDDALAVVTRSEWATSLSDPSLPSQETI